MSEMLREVVSNLLIRNIFGIAALQTAAFDVLWDTQPADFNFPTTGDRRCRREGFKEYPFLTYNVGSDSLTWHSCCCGLWWPFLSFFCHNVSIPAFLSDAVWYADFKNFIVFLTRGNFGVAGRLKDQLWLIPAVFIILFGVQLHRWSRHLILKYRLFASFWCTTMVLCRLVRTQWPFEFQDFYRRCTAQRPAAVSTQNYSLVVTVLTMTILHPGQFILRTNHLILSAWVLSCFWCTYQDMIAVGMLACRHCRTPVLQNHQDDKAPADKISYALIAIYCSWTNSFSTTFKQFWTPVATGRPTVHCRRKSPNSNVIVDKPIDT